jgi:hypothetical protein
MERGVEGRAEGHGGAKGRVGGWGGGWTANRDRVRKDAERNGEGSWGQGRGAWRSEG